MSAVFLSYASQDTEAARRICEALRAAGVEVWFDQNELGGGDVWDAKIRGQIKACALFVPVISAATNARREGYFRREWKLAVDRTHDMDEALPFLCPVVIDGTTDAGAFMPEKFREVQWTQLPGGETSDIFCARVKALLNAGAGVPLVSENYRPDARVAQPGTRLPLRLGRRWLASAIVGITALIALVIWRPWQKPSPTAAHARVATSVPSRGSVAPSDIKPAVDPKSVAVLPFQNLSAEPDSAYFADGLHEEMLTAVGKVSALRVIGRASVLPYADAKKRNLARIGNDLGVASVVEGTVRRAGNRVRIAVQLVDAQSSRQLWGQAFERELTDIFAVQAAIAEEVAATLNATFTARERAVIGQQLTQNAEAYQLYLQGMAAIRNMGYSGMADRARQVAAIAIFDRAVAADPAFVLPHLQLTRLHGQLFWFGELDPTPERAAKAEASAAAVRQLAPSSPEAHLAAGFASYLCRHEWTTALAEFRAARQGLPNESEAINWEGNALRRLGRWSEALEAFVRAAAIDPQGIDRAENLVQTQILMRRYSEAIRTVDDFMRRSTTSASLAAFRAVAQFEISHYRALLAYLQGDQARTHAEAADARRYFEGHAWSKRQQPMVAAELAMAAALAGESEAARTALQ